MLIKKRFRQSFKNGRGPRGGGAAGAMHVHNRYIPTSWVWCGGWKSWFWAHHRFHCSTQRKKNRFTGGLQATHSNPLALYPKRAPGLRRGSMSSGHCSGGCTPHSLTHLNTKQQDDGISSPQQPAPYLFSMQHSCDSLTLKRGPQKNASPHNGHGPRPFYKSAV